jgi:hypothetical protein
MTQSIIPIATNVEVVVDCEVGIREYDVGIREYDVGIREYDVGIRDREVGIQDTPSQSNIGSKICIIICMTILLCPFIICDFYYALTDTSCVNQAYERIHLTMRTYLLVNASLGLIIISFINITILLCDFDHLEIDSNILCLKLFDYIYKLFTLAWIIVGCVIFWRFMDTSKCDTSVYNYLMARFIISIICYVSVLSFGDSSKNK